jgi:hypothetical protein
MSKASTQPRLALAGRPTDQTPRSFDSCHPGQLENIAAHHLGHVGLGEPLLAAVVNQLTACIPKVVVSRSAPVLNGL